MENEKIVRTIIHSGQQPTEAQIREIEMAAMLPVTPDEDAPELTLEQYTEMAALAKAAGLKLGVYFFTQAVNEAEAVEEASAVVSLVQDYELKLPIYIDIESAGGNGRADGLDKETRTLVGDAFCRTCKNAGYNSGVYACRYWLYNNLDMSVLEKYEVWDAVYVSVPQYTGYYTMWQHSSKGQIDGINGNVDLDIYYY